MIIGCLSTSETLIKSGKYKVIGMIRLCHKAQNIPKKSAFFIDTKAKKPIRQGGVSMTCSWPTERQRLTSEGEILGVHM